MLRDAETSAAKPERAIAPVQEINLKSIDQQKLEVSNRVTFFKERIVQLLGYLYPGLYRP